MSNQLNFRPEVYDYIRQIGLSSWKKLPKSGAKKEELTKIRQGSDEPYEEFVARLLQVSARLIEDSDAALILVKELAFENANSICQATLRPWKGKATLNDYVRLCSEIGPAYVQGVTLAAALKGQSIEQAQRVPGPPGSCYTCGKMGHVAKECKDKSAPFKQPSSKDPGICPKCKRGKHWANECHSRRNKDGNLLVNTPGLQGNERMGQPRAQKTKRGIFPVSKTNRNTEFFQSAKRIATQIRFRPYPSNYQRRRIGPLYRLPLRINPRNGSASSPYRDIWAVTKQYMRSDIRA